MEVSKYAAVDALTTAMMWDGAMGTLIPVQHCLAWRGGPRWWRDSIDWFVAHPELTRTLGVVQLGVGMWLAARAINSARGFHHGLVS